MRRLFIFIFLSVSFVAVSQEILLEQNVKGDTIKPTHGQNLKHFSYGYAGISFPVFTNEDAVYTKFGVSTAYDFGIRYKRKLTNTFAFGLDWGMSFADYHIKQGEGKMVPDTIINDKEKYLLNTMNGSVYFRFNVGRRGNYLGNYLDLGAYGGWNITKKHKTVNETEADEKVKVVTSRLKYFENFQYGILARIGIGRYALTARYRLSDLMVPESSIPELPFLMIGAEIGLFR